MINNQVLGGLTIIIYQKRIFDAMKHSLLILTHTRGGLLRF